MMHARDSFGLSAWRLGLSHYWAGLFVMHSKTLVLYIFRPRLSTVCYDHWGLVELPKDSMWAVLVAYISLHLLLLLPIPRMSTVFSTPWGCPL